MEEKEILRMYDLLMGRDPQKKLKIQRAEMEEKEILLGMYYLLMGRDPQNKLKIRTQWNMEYVQK